VSDEIEKIKMAHEVLHDLIHRAPHFRGKIIELGSARPGQLGLGYPVVDENGDIWRIFNHPVRGQVIEFVGGSMSEQLDNLANLDDAMDAEFARGMPQHEFDHDVVSRAADGADAPYNQDTCRRYPWAAAARITYLEDVVREFGLILRAKVGHGIRQR
jgi:hypothetical protein